LYLKDFNKLRGKKFQFQAGRTGNKEIRNQYPLLPYLLISHIHQEENSKYLNFTKSQSSLNQIKMDIHVLQHVSYEGPGIIRDWARKNNHRLHMYPVFMEDGSWPQFHSDDVLVVMGGPMNIYEEEKYPWLSNEKAFIRETVATGRKVLGICLGAQLIADVIGGRVVRNNHTEIGWFPIRWTKQARDSNLFKHSEEEMVAYHWHGDRFELPADAELLAGSEGCANQAFRYMDNVVGFQFHAEMRMEDAQRLIEHSRDELKPGTYIQSEKHMMARPELFDDANEWMTRFLDHFWGRW
jgi:GMP synthase-like glutamine amidotransferase